MLKTIISQGDFAIWPEISLIIFCLTFLAILIWVNRKNSGKHYRYMADLVCDEQGARAEEQHDR